MSYPMLAPGMGSLPEFISYVSNDLTGGMWAIAMVFVIFIVAFLALASFYKEEALAASALITFISALLLRTLELLNDFWLFLWLIILALSIIMLHKR